MKRKNAKSPSFDEIKVKDPEAFAAIEKLGHKLIWATITAGIRQGTLRLGGKSADQRAKLLLRHLKLVSRSEIAWSLDYKSTLLQEAKSAFERELPSVAVILLATYFEHYLNELVLTACTRRKTSTSIAQRLVRTTSFPDKTERLLPELGFPAIPLAVRNAMCATAKIRNENVHYRWEGLNEREMKAQDDRLNSVLTSGFQAASNLSRYDHDTFMEDISELEAQFHNMERNGHRDSTSTADHEPKKS